MDGRGGGCLRDVDGADSVAGAEPTVADPAEMTERHVTKLRSVMTAAAGILFWAAGARAEWRLVTSDFAEQEGLTVNTWEVRDGLSVTTETGKLMKVDTRKVLSLASEKVKPGDATGSPWKLIMRNGDVLFGEPAGISGQSLQFTMPEAGKILVPL